MVWPPTRCGCTPGSKLTMSGWANRPPPKLFIPIMRIPSGRDSQRVWNRRQPAFARKIGKGLMDRAHQMTKARDGRKRQVTTCPMRAVDPRDQAVTAALHIDHGVTVHCTNWQDHRNRPGRQPRHGSEYAASCSNRNVQNPPQDVPPRISGDHPVPVHLGGQQRPRSRHGLVRNFRGGDSESRSQTRWSNGTTVRSCPSILRWGRRNVAVSPCR